MTTDHDASAAQGSIAPSIELLSILVPVYNEQEALPEFHKRLISALSNVDMGLEVLYVNDGSTDSSLEVLRQLGDSDDRVCVLTLSRNFGKEIAMAAGLDHVRGDAVVIIDADLQDPQKDIPLIYFKQRPYSAEFYSRGSARQIDSEAQLRLCLAKPTPTYVATEQAVYAALPDDLRARLAPVTTSLTGKYVLLRHETIEPRADFIGSASPVLSGQNVPDLPNTPSAAQGIH